MAKRLFIFIICVAMIASASLAMAGGPAYAKAQARYSKGYGAPQQNCAYWGDAPFPGMCGGVVALPFLVVGSLLGGNPVGPCGPAPATPPRYMPGPAPGPYANTGCGPQGYAGSYQNGSMLAGLPCFDLCNSLMGAATGGTGLLY